MNDILRLHTDCDGVVWCGQNGVRAVNSKLLPEEFVSRNTFKTAKRVRVLGTSSNALLIVRAYDAQKKNSLVQLPTHTAMNIPASRLEVGSPAICPTASLRMDPVEALQRMWQLDTSARLSANWRFVDSNIFNSYLLVVSMSESDDKARVVFRYHPLVRFFGFFGHFDVQSCMKWVSEIVDPRWFIHSDKPHRMTKLMRFLGLKPSNFKLLTSGKTKSLQHKNGGYRAQLTYLCWNTEDSNTVDYDSSSNFLWRIYRDHDYGWEGALAASRAFVRFASLHWQDSINLPRRKLFDPDIFFKSSEEAEAYYFYTNSNRVQG